MVLWTGDHQTLISDLHIPRGLQVPGVLNILYKKKENCGGGAVISAPLIYWITSVVRDK